MTKRSRMTTLILLLIFAASVAHAFVDPPTLVPLHPVAGQTISVSIRAGYCDYFIEKNGYPQISQTGNAIHIILASVHATNGQFCIPPPSTLVTPIGTYAPGSYTLKVDRVYTDEVSGNDVVETLGTLAFSVAAAPQTTTAVPTLTSVGIALLIAGILAAVCFTNRRRYGLLLVAAVCLIPATGARAQAKSDAPHVVVLMSAQPGAPAPADIINYLQAGKVGPPPSQALTTANPQSASYLLPFRASGDFRTYLLANTDSPRAKLERYLIVQYPSAADINLALAAWRSAPNVEAAYLPDTSMRFSSVELRKFSVTGPESVENGQYGRDALNIVEAWQIAGGYGLVGDIDSGLAVDHPALRQFSGTGQYVGGNFVPVASFDIGDWPSSMDNNVDEEEPVPQGQNSPCNPQHLPAVPPAYAGHGTHVSGIIAANGSAGLGLKGVCEHCGLAQVKIAKVVCRTSTQQLIPSLNSGASAPALTYLSDTAAQVVNMSFGSDSGDYCPTHTNDPMCLAITYANERDIVLVGASGNNRTRVQSPGSDARVIAVGGFDTSINLWDESPGSNTNCPPGYGGKECGSNYTTVSGGPKQELMAAAKSVLSTAYPDYNWNPDIDCGDSFGTPIGDGIG